MRLRMKGKTARTQRGAGEIRRRRLGLGFAALVVSMLALAIGLDRNFPPHLDRLRHVSVLVEDSDGQLLRPFAAADGAWRLPVTVDHVDPRFLQMLVAYEDRRFYWHAGVDPLALVRAVWQWARNGSVVSGASTLTMQTVRLLEPRPRTLGSKLIEIARAAQLEAHFSKSEILGIYLTLAPYGGNLEGVRAASLFYFGKEPAHLTDGEAAMLVALPQQPERVRPDRNPAAAREARDHVLQRLESAGLIGETELAELGSEAVPQGRRQAPMVAAHLAERLKAADPASTEIRTTIDGSLQRGLEALVARRRGELEAGATIAVLAVRNSDHAVRGYVGSTDILDTSRHGPIDMVTAVRSPGSTLKPFIYGLAFDGLLIHPETIMVDRPMRFGDYAPRNFDNRFHGEMTAREALQMSLNLPAVALLDRIGPLELARRFGLSGVTLRLPSETEQPGLPIALGGVGVTLQDLVTLYAGLANKGTTQPLRFRLDQEEGDKQSLMSALAAWYVTHILEDMPPPPNRLIASDGRRQRQIAYKTGTSYGFRDAWAIGYDREWTIGVWVGRPDGSFSPGRLGRDAAAPILYEAFDLLPPPSGNDALMKPSGPAPAGAILATNGELPASLRRFQPSAYAWRSPSGLQGPSLTFPQDGAVVELKAGDHLASLPLEVTGGELPLIWLVNGRPLSAQPWRRQAEWLPDGMGEARITVIDKAGRSASAEIWIQ
jgi:penicillin-binding protein 1C